MFVVAEPVIKLISAVVSSKERLATPCFSDSTSVPPVRRPAKTAASSCPVGRVRAVADTRFSAGSHDMMPATRRSPTAFASASGLFQEIANPYRGRRALVRVSNKSSVRLFSRNAYCSTSSGHRPSHPETFIRVIAFFDSASLPDRPNGPGRFFASGRPGAPIPSSKSS